MAGVPALYVQGKGNQAVHCIDIQDGRVARLYAVREVELGESPAHRANSLWHYSLYGRWGGHQLPTSCTALHQLATRAHWLVLHVGQHVTWPIKAHLDTQYVAQLFHEPDIHSLKKVDYLGRPDILRNLLSGKSSTCFQNSLRGSSVSPE